MRLPPLTTDRPRLDIDDVARLIGRDNPIILEIGANDGTDSRRFLDAFPRCRLFCFEPDERAIEEWRANIGNDPRAVLLAKAVGASDGPIAFHVSDGDGRRANWNKSGSIRAPKNMQRWPWLRFPKTVEVECTRLDTWLGLQPIDRIDFIWADVQGAEGDLIAGAPEALARTRYFYTEYSNDEWYEGQVDLRTLVDSLPGFEVAELFRIDVLFRRSPLSG